ncbi:MAG: hypothetical protein QNJ77_04120 [Acidimicrobiia bacterium]|nr:hypothetical protein [Acidimicrobiia bacterium]
MAEDETAAAALVWAAAINQESHMNSWDKPQLTPNNEKRDLEIGRQYVDAARSRHVSAGPRRDSERTGHRSTGGMR